MQFMLYLEWDEVFKFLVVIALSAWIKVVGIGIV